MRLSNSLTGDGRFWPAPPKDENKTREANPLATWEAAPRTVRD